MVKDLGFRVFDIRLLAQTQAGTKYPEHPNGTDNFGIWDSGLRVPRPGLFVKGAYRTFLKA